MDVLLSLSSFRGADSITCPAPSAGPLLAVATTCAGLSTFAREAIRPPLSRWCWAFAQTSAPGLFYYHRTWAGGD